MVQCGEYVKVLLADGMILEGEVVRVGADNMVVDDVSAFGDWDFIEFRNIVSIAKAQ